MFLNFINVFSSISKARLHSIFVGSFSVCLGESIRLSIILSIILFSTINCFSRILEELLEVLKKLTALADLPALALMLGEPAISAVRTTAA